MNKLAALFIVSAVLCLGNSIPANDFPKLPKPMPNVEHVGKLPDVKIEVYEVKNGVVDEKPTVVKEPESKGKSKIILLIYDPEVKEESSLKK
ncbi:MAG: hypothetical protein WD898_00900 [Candidatus Paceibacterota bacterium]